MQCSGFNLLDIRHSWLWSHGSIDGISKMLVMKLCAAGNCWLSCGSRCDEPQLRFPPKIIMSPLLQYSE